MLKLSFPKKVKFICGFIYKDEKIYEKVKIIMQKKFGAIDYESEIINFNFTNYYEKEMGKNLLRRFVSFKILRKIEEFRRIKLYCIQLEKKFSYQDRRHINIDPGYLNEAKLVLLSTKDFYHRIYLGKGIFCELTLYYANKNFQDLPWTYPDYRTSSYKNIFSRIRNIYRNQIKSEK
ncbi:MAG: hypothetical protein B6D56_08285 [Candidatus Omnitrophica bacterium 4484_70.1]|nr:MAG: hypothetical protein B6D56_08285 [Candidatus Omnitrophica bacterium 4484_70.1]